MPGTGPAPKLPEQRQRPKQGVQSRKLTAEPYDGPVPALPGAKDLSAATRRWYRTWARSPQAHEFTVTEWQRLHMLAPLVERYHAEPTKDLMAEIRLNEERLGATLLDRRRIGIEIEKPKDAEVKPMPSRQGDPRLRAVQ